MGVAALLFALVLISAAALAFSLLGLNVVRRLVRHGVGDGHNDVSAAIFGVGGTIYAVFLAFLVITIWAAHDNARMNMAEEASLLATLYRSSSAMEPQSRAQLRGLIREYTHAVIDDEWAIQASTGGASEKARAAGLNMFRVFGGVPAELRRDNIAVEELQLNLLAQIQADRNKRTLQAQEFLSPMIWVVALAEGVIVIVMSFFLYPDRDWPHVCMSTMLAAMIAMLVFVMFIFAQPFRGLLPLQPEPFAHSLNVYDSVDRTPYRTMEVADRPTPPLRARSPDNSPDPR
jgi:hypothetical protein